MYKESGMYQALVSRKGKVSKERTYHAKAGAYFCSHGSQPCRQCKKGLEGYVVRSVYGWTDRTVVLQWMTGKGSYKQFLANRVLTQINATAYKKWRYTGTEQRHPV